MIDKIFSIFSFFGIGIFIYLIVITIHEYGHYLKLKQEGVAINEFVILGWKNDAGYNYTSTSFGWVQPKTDYNTDWHQNCWDNLPNLITNRSCWK